jgi:single-strand DNA-binding protein
MGSLNKVLLIGRLGADPEIRYAQDGSPIATLRLATSEFGPSKDGRREERTEWHRIVCFGRLAKVCEDYLRKGRQAFIEGRIQTRQWESPQGKRFMTEIIALNLQMLDSRTAHEAPNVQLPGKEGQEGSFADYGFEAPVDVDEPATSLDKGSPLQNPDDELPF